MCGRITSNEAKIFTPMEQQKAELDGDFNEVCRYFRAMVLIKEAQLFYRTGEDRLKLVV